MFPYSIIMLPAILTLQYPKKPPIAYLLVIGFVLVIFAGGRFNVGMDWNNYLAIMRKLGQIDFFEVFDNTEPGFNALAWLVNDMEMGVLGIDLISAAVFFWGIISLARKTPEPFLALLVACSFLMLVAGLSAIRQAMAIGIVYAAFANWDSIGTFKRTAYILVASTFHLSSLALLLVVALATNLSFMKKALIGSVLGALAVYVLSSADSHVGFYVNSYTGENQVQSDGAFIHTFLNAGPAILYFSMKKKWDKAYGDNLLLTILSGLAIGCFFAVFVSSVAAARFSFYLTSASMMFLAGLPGLFAQKSAIRALILAAHISIYYGWLIFSNTGKAYIPYTSYFFDDV